MKKIGWLLMWLLSGCSLWVMVGGVYVSNEYMYEVELPANWRRGYSTRDGLTLTRDGVTLQFIKIVRNPFDKDAPNTKRKLAKGMLPQEVAEIVVDDFRSNRNISNFQVLENLPATVGGHAGFKIAFSYQTKDNLQRMGVYYGALIDQWFYSLYYEAPARHYFLRDQPVFERVKETFKISI